MSESFSPLDLSSHPTFGSASLGAVLSVRGSEACVGLPAPALSEQLRATVGTFLAIAAGAARLIGVVTEVASSGDVGDTRFGAVARVDLMGEIETDADGAERFLRGVSAYPAIGDAARIIGRDELAAHLQGLQRQRRSTSARCITTIRSPADVDVDNLLSKHFAVLGSTGVGKSSGVAVILNEILDARPEPAHLPARRPQRIRPLLRPARQRRQRRDPEAAVLAVQFRGIRRRALLRTARRRRGSRHPRRAYPDRQGPLPGAAHVAATARRCAGSTREAPATPSTRRFPI